MQGFKLSHELLDILLNFSLRILDRIPDLVCLAGDDDIGDRLRVPCILHNLVLVELQLLLLDLDLPVEHLALGLQEGELFGNVLGPFDRIEVGIFREQES